MYEYKAKLRRVVDGDTVDLDVDLGFHMTAQIRFRLAGIDAPEKRKPTYDAGIASMVHLAGLLEGKKITVQTGKTGKYGRWIATLYTDLDGPDEVVVNDQMVTDGHAIYRSYG